MSDETKRMLYVQTSGVNTPERAATPFYLATAAAAMDMEAVIFFSIMGSTLLKKGVAENLRVKRDDDRAATLKFFIDQAVDMGVKLYVCQPSLDLTGVQPDELIEGIEIVGGARFNEMALEADKVLCF